MTACILVPRRASTPAGSSRSPYISRFTVRCATLRSGASARAAAAAAIAAATVPERRSPLTSTATRAAYPATEDGDQGDVHQGPVGQPLDVEEPVPAQRNRDSHHEWQPRQADRAGGQQLVARDELWQMPPGETEHTRRDAAAGNPSQPTPGQRIATAPIRHDAQHCACHQRRRDHGSRGRHTRDRTSAGTFGANIATAAIQVSISPRGAA